MYFTLAGGAVWAACSGTVLDEFDEGIIGASVVVKGTSQGSTTDFNGNFTLSDCIAGNILQVSYIGYQSQEFCVGAPSGIRIGMCSDDSLSGSNCGTSSTQGTNCGSGGGCTTLQCTACETAATEWVGTGTAGYETRMGGGTCSGNSCTSNGICSGQIREYRCATGYTGTTTDGKTGCRKLATCTTGCCGTVISDNDGFTLPSASVILIKSTTPLNGYAEGATSDYDGIYNISSCEVGDKLIFTFLGYVRQEITITSANRSNATIRMSDDPGDATCDAGYYMDWSTGQSVCKRCPSDNGVPGTIPASNSSNFDNTIYYCKIPYKTSIADTSGTYEYSSDCYYK